MYITGTPFLNSSSSSSLSLSLSDFISSNSQRSEGLASISCLVSATFPLFKVGSQTSVVFALNGFYSSLILLFVLCFFNLFCNRFGFGSSISVLMATLPFFPSVRSLLLVRVLFLA